ncbi:MAG: PEP-CTERM sorting domain-containing protein [Verrucomicrobiales bacterium]
MKRPSHATCLLLLGLAVPVHAATIATGVVRNYATAGVDTNSSGNGLASADPLDVAGFATNVGNAYDNDMGGVINFEDPITASDTSSGHTDLAVTYGGGKALNIISSGDSTNSIYTNAFSSLGSVSGSDGLLQVGGSNTAWRLTFDPQAPEIITTAAFSLLSRNNTGQDVTVRWFIDGETDPLNAAFTTTESIASGVNVDNTFFAYEAPDGSAITSFRIEFLGTQGDRRLGIDDLAFITEPIPEPSALLLLGLAAPAVLRRKR